MQTDTWKQYRDMTLTIPRANGTWFEAEVELTEHYARERMTEHASRLHNLADALCFAPNLTPQAADLMVRLDAAAFALEGR